MDSAKVNRIAITILIVLIIAGTTIYLIYDSIQPKRESKAEVAVMGAPQEQGKTNGPRKRVSPPPQALPQLNLLHLDGTPLNLADYSGKIVLVQIWSASAPISLQEINYIKPIHDKFLLDPRFVMIGICADSDAAAISRIVERGQALKHAIETTGASGQHRKSRGPHLPRSSSTMRASPRTWPSIRPSLFIVVALASFRMSAIYPYGV